MYTLFFKTLSEWIEPETVFMSFFGNKKESFWLDSSLYDENTARFSYMGDCSGPHAKTITYNLSKNVITHVQYGKKREYNTDIFSFLEKELQKNHIRSVSLPCHFTGGFVGYFGYELKELLGAKNAYKSDYPDSVWFFVDRLFAFDHTTNTVYLVCLAKTKSEAEEWFSGVALRIPTHYRSKKAYVRKARKIQYTLARSHTQYIKDIETCKKYLKEGESYQLCLTNIIQAKANIDTLSLYRYLRKINPAPYSAYIRWNNLAILCSSPEEFLSVDQNRIAQSKPMKGTMQRSSNQKKDARLAKALVTNPKEQAENLMIVDLLRNDLGKVCKVGSVTVPKLMEIETYATVHQLVSTVQGRLKKDVSVIDCIKACFPGGSMTGAPKIRAMELLEKIEKSSRGIYSGALGFISLNGSTKLNIVIRTIIARNDMLSIGVGGAILIDSEPENEFQETILKGKALLLAIAQKEPMHTVVFSLGTNIGNRKQALQKAIELLGEKIVVEKSSPVYETIPVGFVEQRNFYNQCILGKTHLSPTELLQFVKEIEKTMGRKKRFQNGPREIDLDIIFYDDKVFSTEVLVIPHPRMQERDFVLTPLNDIAPEMMHPVLHKNVHELFTELSKNKPGIVGKV